MEPALVAALIGAAALVVVAVVNGIVVIVVAKMGRTIRTLEKNTNSKMDALLVATAGEAQLQGEKDGRASERADTHIEAVEMQTAREAVPPQR